MKKVLKRFGIGFIGLTLGMIVMSFPFVLAIYFNNQLYMLFSIPHLIGLCYLMGEGIDLMRKDTNK